MYAKTVTKLYYPKAKDWDGAKKEVKNFGEKYCKEIGGKDVAAYNKVYGWCWNISIYI